MSSSSNRQEAHRPGPVQSNFGRRLQARRLARSNPPIQRVDMGSAAARLERRRRYSATGPRDQWPEPNLAREPAVIRRVRAGCRHGHVIVRVPRPAVRRSDGTLVSPPSTPPPPGLSEPELASWHRKRQLEEMQGSQLVLWDQGHLRLGRVDDAHVFVRALPLARARSPTASTSEEPDVPTSSLSSPTSKIPKRLSLRAIVHSRSNPPFGLKREFDLDALRETIPEPLHDTKAPGFDREQWLSRVQLSSDSRRASWPAAAPASNIKDSVAGETKAAETAETAESNAPVQAPGLQSMGVPINLEYARTSLPALAAIIMSDRVKRGDMIDLALPHPEAWPETVAYVYLGRVELLSAETEKNIIYLGGKIGKKNDGLYGYLSHMPECWI